MAATPRNLAIHVLGKQTLVLVSSPALLSRRHHAMKRCVFCGGEYPEEVTVCPLDRQPLDYDTLLLPVTPSRDSPPMGTAFDVSTIAPQIRKVRQDHIAALRARPHD